MLEVKISWGGGGVKILGTQGWEKLGTGEDFFLQAGWEVTLDDTMVYDNVTYFEICGFQKTQKSKHLQN